MFDEQCKESKGFIENKNKLKSNCYFYYKKLLGACVILFVPSLLDSSEEERTKYLDIVKTVQFNCIYCLFINKN